MRRTYCLLLAVALLALVSCGSDDNGIINGITIVSSDDGTSNLEADDIEFDESELDEGEETIPTDDEDYVENRSFAGTVYLAYSSSSVEASGDVNYVDISVSGAHVVVSSDYKMEYVLSGESDDGSFKNTDNDKYIKITLNGLTLTNPTGAVINDQSGKSMFLVLGDGTENTLTDGSSYTTTDDEDMKGTIFSEGQIIVSGSGSLSVKANCKNGIASDDYIIFRPGNTISITNSASNGVKANDSVIVRGSVLNIGITASGSKGINCEGVTRIQGGRTTIITTGGTVIEDNDTKSCAGIKSDLEFTMSGGELNIQSSGAGGKGISGDTTIDINDGTIEIVTTGKQYVSGSLDSSPKGIKGDGNVNINGGDITVTCSGGDGAEGIESKATLTITGGDMVVNAYDDAFNASTNIYVSGGRIYAYSSTNDGIDSNGGMYFTGGLAIAYGASTPEGPFDSDNSTFSIKGGTLIGVGGTTSTPTTSSTTQPVMLIGSQSYSSGTYLSLDTSSGENIFAFQIPRTYSSAVLLLSSAELSVGSTYTIKTGVSVSGGTLWQGYTDDSTISGGSTLKTVSQSSTIVSSGTSSGGVGGTGNNGFNGNGIGGVTGGGFGGGWW